MRGIPSISPKLVVQLKANYKESFMFRLILAFFVLHTVGYALDLQCSHVPQITEAFLKAHYIHRTITNEVKEHTIEQYVRGQDPSKTMLLESDVPEIKTQLMQVFEGAKSGSCSSLFEVQRKIVTRAKENEDFVRTFLDDKYKLDETTELITDPKKRGYSKTTPEKQNTLKKMLHFQMYNLQLAKVKPEEARKQLIHRYELITKRFRERKASDVFASFLDSFASALDPHSSFMSPDSLEDFQIQMQLSLEGIGASLRSEDGFTVIEELIKGGSADRAKILKPKDKIIAVAQEKGAPVSVIDMDLRDVVKMIRGKKGTKVILTILRQGDKTETFETTIVRDKVNLEEQAAKLTFEKRKIDNKEYKFGVVDLPGFYGSGGKDGRSCSEDVKTAIRNAKKEKVDGLVLNLSRNGGGLLDEAVKISGLFINTGGVVATKNFRGDVQVLSDEQEGVEYNGPLVVLTSRVSASASEILAGALKDYRRAVIVGGDHTFGKGSVQSLSDLPFNLGGMKVTMAMFFIPSGVSTQQQGVSADVTLPSIYSNDEIGEKTLDYSLPPQKVPAFISKEANSSQPDAKWEAISDSVVKKLAAKSSERVSKDTKFNDLKKKIAKAEKNAGVVKLAELKSEQKNKEAKDAKDGKKKTAEKTSTDEEKKDDEDEKSPFLQESVNVLADLVTGK